MVGCLRGISPRKSLIIIITFTSILTVGCEVAATPIPTSPTSFSYLVHVQAQDTGEDVSEAEVTIEVGDKAPLDAITDSKGVARIFVDSSYAGKPGFLIVEANGYERYTQNIDVIKGVLPDFVHLEPASSITVEVEGEASAEPTEELIASTTEETIIEPPEEPTIELTEESTTQPSPTEEPTVELIISPTTEPTTSSKVEPDNEEAAFEPPTATPIPISAHTPTTPRETTFTGRLTIPLMFGTTPKVYIFDTKGKVLGNLDMARQPDYTRDGTLLIVNGDGGGLDKLRVSDPIGEEAHEIGDPALGGHCHPAWSPDGTQVIYDDGAVDSKGWRILTRKPESGTGPGTLLKTGTGNGEIVDSNPLHPLWTTDDRFIFQGCNTWKDGTDCGMWMMKGNNGTPVKLTTDNACYIPTDVDGDIVVYTSNKSGNWDVYTLNVVTKVTNQLTSNLAADGLATISPDGQWVAFLSNRGGSLAVWYVDIDGDTTPQKMFNIPEKLGTVWDNSWSDEKLSWGR
jgi:hypothetical protein